MGIQEALELIIYINQLSLIDNIVKKYGNDKDIQRDNLINRFIRNYNTIIVNDNIPKKRGRPRKNVSNKRLDNPHKIIIKVKK